ncbi:hypothetical protein ACIOZM_20640 [Pseudomonas sp. NPDC087346]|uniref:hypothetical protein n=1 Tax=Pseudomonas sp. NPDC087346 TaxID=3364438 RepID=UPI00381B6ABA
MADDQLFISVAVIVSMAFGLICASGLRAVEHKSLMWRYISLEKHISGSTYLQQLHTLIEWRQQVEAENRPCCMVSAITKLCG